MQPHCRTTALEVAGIGGKILKVSRIARSHHFGNRPLILGIHVLRPALPHYADS